MGISLVGTDTPVVCDPVYISGLITSCFSARIFFVGRDEQATDIDPVPNCFPRKAACCSISKARSKEQEHP